MLPDPNDPLSPLITALELARSGQRLSKLLNAVRRINETDDQALIRLVKERDAIGDILNIIGVKHEQFDNSYRNCNIVDELHRKLIKRGDSRLR